MLPNKKLSKLKMPGSEKPKATDESSGLELDLAEEGESEVADDDDFEAAEPMAMAEEDAEAPAANDAVLKKVSDDELLAEMKKRGLDKSSSKPEGDEELDEIYT